MSDTDRGQLSASAAEVYDAFFVPALFEQWTEVVLDVADVRPGHRVLDIGCGTGVLARAAHVRVGAHGHVAGVDPNEGMLTIARRAGPDVEWQPGVAEQLPYRDHSFDRAVSQFALMYFTDPEYALSEVCRVTRPGGRVALAVWDRLDNNRGYARLAALVEELFGSDAAGAIRVPFHMGDPDALLGLAATALSEPTVTRHPGVARFETVHAWVHTEIRGWTLADSIDDHGFATLLDAAQEQLSDLATDMGLPSTCPRSSSAAARRKQVDEMTRRYSSWPYVATGYSLDYGWIEAPLLDELGYPRNTRGVGGRSGDQ